MLTLAARLTLWQKSLDSILANVTKESIVIAQCSLFVYGAMDLGTMVLSTYDGTRRAGKRGKDFNFEAISAGKLYTAVV